MPKLATPLTDIKIRAAKPKDKPYQLADGEGMYLEVRKVAEQPDRLGVGDAAALGQI